MVGRPRMNMKGVRVNRFTFLEDTGMVCKNGSAIWLAVCDCGTLKEIRLLNRHAQYSCGCASKAEDNYKRVMARLNKMEN